MPRKIVILLLIVFIGGLLFPFLTLAGDYEGYGKTIHYEGLVPCGKSEASSTESAEVTERCQFCHLFVMLDGIIDFVTQKIVPPVVVLMMVIAGIMFFFGGGNPSLLLQAKKLITSVVIGLVIMFSAFLIVQTILNVMGVADTNPLHSWLTGNFFTIECKIEKGGGGVTPGPGPGPTPLPSDYDKQVDCEGAGYYWYNGECHGEPKELSASTDPTVLYQQTVKLSCEAGQTRVGDGICTATSLTTTVTKDEPYGVNGWLCEFTDASVYTAPIGTLTIKCTGAGVTPTVPASDYTTEDECTNAGYYWYDGACHEEPEPEPESKCEDCGAGLFNICDEAECLSLGDCQFTPNWWGGGKCETIESEPEPEPVLTTPPVTYSEPVQGNPGSEYVERAVMCNTGQMAIGGDCIPGQDTTVYANTATQGTTQGGAYLAGLIGVDAKGWYCEFKSLYPPTSNLYEVPPSGTATVDCISATKVDLIFASGGLSGFASAEGSLKCDSGEIAEGGNCIPNDYSITTGSGITDDGKGWFCKFARLDHQNQIAGGIIGVTCVPETTAAAILVTTPIAITDKSVETGVNSVPSSQTIIGDNVYSVVPQEDTKAPATITLSYDDSQIVGLDENTLAIYHYDEVLSRWVGLPSTVDKVNNTVTATTDHLSIFAIMGRKATVTDCECISGPCCTDGCHYDENLQSCDYESDYLWGCTGQDEPNYEPYANCGNSVTVQTRLKYQYCSGDSAECNGKWTDFGNWSDKETFKACNKTEYCVGGTGECEYSSFCNSQYQCGDGACCDAYHYSDKSQKCDAETEPQYGCPDGTGCGDDLSIRARKRDRYCPGNSEDCLGEWGNWGDWTEWEISKSCSDTEFCSSEKKSCVYSPLCGPNNNCECLDGSCCDGCHYYGTDHECYIDSQEKYGCPWGTGCGDDVGFKTQSRVQYCSGQSAECNGSFGKWGDWDDNWLFLKDCDSTQVCQNGDCEYSEACGCQCSEGDECCKDGCHYDADGTVCWTGNYSKECMFCEYEDECSITAGGMSVREVKTCDNGKCSNVDYEKSPNCACARTTVGDSCGEDVIICEHSTANCPNCPDNYCKKSIFYKCVYGKCNMSNTFWGECCTPEVVKECESGTTCCTSEGYYEEAGKICQEYDWSECTGGEYTSECDNMKIGSQSKKTMACNDTGSCNVPSWELYQDCVITKNTSGIPCEGDGHCENGGCVHPPQTVCTPGTSCCTSDGQYKAKGTRCYTDSTWGTCITDWDTASDCQESITGEQYKNHKTCDAFGSCSVDDKEKTSCTDTRDTDGDYCGSAGLYLRHCKNGKCVTDEPAYGDECDPLSTCCTSGGYYESSGTRCDTDTSWSSCSDCDYNGSCDEKADGTKGKTHKNCNSSGSCSVVEKEEKDCTCTRDTDGKKCGGTNRYCSAGKCHSVGIP